MVNKITKRLLFISDDFNKYSWTPYKEILSNGEYYYDEESNWLSFECEIVTTIKKALELIQSREFDLILVDYGLVGNEVKDFKRLCEKEYVVYTGGLDKHYIMNDIKKSPFTLPELDFIHYGVEDAKYDLYNLFDKVKEGSK